MPPRAYSGNHPLMVRRKALPIILCTTPKCGALAVPGEYLCVGCRARMADIRERLTAEAQERRRPKRRRRSRPMVELDDDEE